jgi:hypothetical protein
MSIFAFAQDDDIWYRFEDNKTELIGFKDANGKMKIEPKFLTMTPAYRFDKIIAVVESKGDAWDSYYLTKTGKKVGIESMHVYDNGFDCESEGFIRFKDQKIGKVGLFDGDGSVAIPPIYNYTSRVHNGMLFALQGALKRQDGEHTFHVGGVETLINTENQILIENFTHDDNINLYSIAIEDANHSISPIRDYFEGNNGEIYSFINYKKEFKHWFESVWVNARESEKIEKYFFDKLSYWDDNYGWIHVQKKDLKSSFIHSIVTKIDGIKIKNQKYNLFLEHLNKFIYTSKEFVSYYDNCGDALTSRYPVINIVVDGKNKGGYVQDHFEFLRTDDGYKLVGVSIRSK